MVVSPLLRAGLDRPNLKTIKEVHEYFNASLELGGFSSRWAIRRSTAGRPCKSCARPTPTVLRYVIPCNTDLRDAHFQRQDIFTFSPRSSAALAYDSSFGELFKWQTKNQNTATSRDSGWAFFPRHGQHRSGPRPWRRWWRRHPWRPARHNRTPVRSYARPAVRPSGRVRLSGRTPVRRIVRHPFEFYEDQIEQLRRRS